MFQTAEDCTGVGSTALRKKGFPQRHVQIPCCLAVRDAETWLWPPAGPQLCSPAPNAKVREAPVFLCRITGGKSESGGFARPGPVWMKCDML